MIKTALAHSTCAYKAAIQDPQQLLPDITTEELALQCGVKPQSVRVSLCRTGSYFGVKPVKLPNGRLMWPGNARQQMMNRAAQGGLICRGEKMVEETGNERSS